MLIIWALALGCSLSGDFSPEDLHASFWANYNLCKDDYKQALIWHKKHLPTLDLPGYRYRGLLHFFKKTDNMRNIIALMPIVENAFIDDIEMQLLFINALQRTGAQREADERIINLASKVKDNQEIAFYATQTYLRRKEPENALAVIDNYLATAQARLNTFIFYFLKAQVYLSSERKDKALIELKRSLEVHPGFDKGWLLFALLQEQKGNLTKAIKGYRTFVDLSSQPSSQVTEHLMRLIFQQKMLEARKHEAYIDLSAFEQALMLFQEKNYRKALEKIDESLIKEPRSKESRLLKTEILYALNRAVDALKEVYAWSNTESDGGLWLELAHLIACKNGLEKQLISLLKHRQIEEPKRLELALYLSDLYTRIADIPRAVCQHKKAFGLTHDTTLRAQILTHLALIYYNNAMLDYMPELVAQAEKLPHSFAPLFNTLAYWYATEQKNNAKAEELISRALIQEPKNPYYLDTQEVICSKKKESSSSL